MKRNRVWLYLLMAIAGALSLCLGWLVLVGEEQKAVSGLCIGLGAAVFCLGIGNLIGALVVSPTETAEAKRRKNIEVNDERNTRIREKVGANTARVVNYALCVIVLAMAFMGVSTIAIVMVASVFLVELASVILLSNYYAQRM